MVDVSYDFPNRFGLENSQRISNWGALIQAPHTRVGKALHIKLQNTQEDNPFYKNPRLASIVGSLISLTEVEAVAVDDRQSLFSNKANQRSLIRAMAMRVEDVVKKPYSSIEEKNYYDYQGFMNHYLDLSRELEGQLEKNPNPSADIVSDLFYIFNKATNAKVSGINRELEKSVLFSSLIRHVPEFAEEDGVEYLKIINNLKKLRAGHYL